MKTPFPSGRADVFPPEKSRLSPPIFYHADRIGPIVADTIASIPDQRETSLIYMARGA